MMNSEQNTAQNTTQQEPRTGMRKFVALFLWILIAGVIALLIAMRSDHGVPLLFGVLIALALYKLTGKLVSGRARGIRIAAWTVMAVASYAIYVFLWQQWGMLQVEVLRYQLDQPVREHQKLVAKDTYGGKTPQETYEMYIAAMKEGNAELAAKYFELGRTQRENKWFLENLKKLGSLEKWAQTKPQWNSFVETSAGPWPGGMKKEYEYMISFTEPVEIISFEGNHLVLGPENSGTTTLMFTFVEAAGIWKIYSGQ